MATKRPASKYTFSDRLRQKSVIRWVAIGFIVYTALAGLSGLKLMAKAALHASPGLLMVAVGAIVLSYICAAITYMLLAVRPLKFSSTLLVAASGGLVNRILPGGLGGLGINLLYLRRAGHSLPVATTIVTTNNILGFMGNIFLLGAALGVFGLDAPHVRLPHLPLSACLALLLLGLIIMVMHRRPRTQRRLVHAVRESLGYFAGMTTRPLHSFGACLSSMTLTSLHVSALYAVIAALGLHTSWPAALVAISVGAFTGAAVPTPGGLGGAEAGIAASLTACGLPAVVSVTVALVYRSITYWLPLLPGYVALHLAEKRNLY